MSFIRSWFTWYYSGHLNCMKYYKFTQYVWLKMQDFEVKNAKNFWGGPSPPQTPPNNEEGDTPSSNSSPQCRGASNFLSLIPPTSQSWIRHCADIYKSRIQERLEIESLIWMEYYLSIYQFFVWYLQNNFDRFWNSLKDYCPKRFLVELPLDTSFCQGWGNRYCWKGKASFFLHCWKI